MNARAHPSRSSSRRGGALLTTIILTLIVAGMAAAVLTLTTASVDSVEQERREVQALYAAESGLSAVMGRLAVAHNTGDGVSPVIGHPEAPVRMETGEYWATITDNGDDSFTVFSQGTSVRARRCIEATVTAVPPGPLSHSMFAGNFSGDPAYSLDLGGTSDQADEVTGDVYSGGDITVTGDATISGEVRSGGTITGADGQSNVSMDIPIILGIDYERFHDYDVAELFEDASPSNSDAGGSAWEVPESNPAHFLRRNPTNRSGFTNSTPKADYFIEDPYETVTSDSDEDGSDAYQVSISSEANGNLFFIDGNLWLHNLRSRSFMFTNDGSEPTRITFVVKGNIYFSDNLFYEDPELDGIAFIALSDEHVEDSGNIYFGDPTFGTMRFAEALMFAENDFIDVNLDASGSSTVTVRGNMTAGNQVAIERDYEHDDGSTSHTRLALEFDERQKNGTLDLPGLPTSRDHAVGFVVATWRELSVPREIPELPSDEIFVENTGTVFGTGDSAWRDRWAGYGDWRNSGRTGRWSPGWNGDNSGGNGNGNGNGNNDDNGNGGK